MDAPESKPTIIKTMYIDQDYLKTLGIELISGQNLNAIFANRYYDGVILNESAAREMGIGRRTGQKVHMNWGDEVKTTGTIVGIVKDFHIRSLHHEIEPLALRLNMDPRYVWHAPDLVVKLRPDTLRRRSHSCGQNLLNWCRRSIFTMPHSRPFLISISYIRRRRD